MDSIDEFFDRLEQIQAENTEDLKDYALHLLSTSTMKDDDEGLEDEIIDTEPTPIRWREIFERLRINQLRAIDMPNWSQTEFNKSYKKHGISN
jgi:hypothetical protein